MKKTDNYNLARLKACKEFLQLNPDRIANENVLKNNKDWIFVTYLYTEYKISKISGHVYHASDESEAGYTETLSIFDLLCHEGKKCLSGEFAPVNSLDGGPVSQGVPMENRELAALIDKHPKAYIDFCKSLGAKQVPIGDIGFEFEIYDRLCARLKFYKSDDEFEASLIILFEKNMLQYVNYETVFYIAGDIERLVRLKISEKDI